MARRQFKRSAVMAATLLASGAAAQAHEVYVSSEKDNSIAVIDSGTLQVVRSFPVGKRPRGITFSNDYSKLYVCASDSDAVQVYDPAGAHLYDLPSGSDPEQFALSPDGARLFIANEDNAVTTVVDLATRQVAAQLDVGVEPEGIAVSPDSRIAVTTSETTNMAHIFDAHTLKSLANIPLPPRPRFARFTADGAKLWVTSEIGGTVSVIDAHTFAVEKTIAFKVEGVTIDKVQPVGLIFSNDGKTAFIALGPANRVAAVDVASGTVRAYILVGQRVWHLALTPDGKLFATNGLSNDVTMIDTATLRAVKSIRVGRLPWGVAVRPDAGP